MPLAVPPWRARALRVLLAAPGLVTLLGVAGLGVFLHGPTSPLALLALVCALLGGWAVTRARPGLPHAVVLSILALTGLSLADRWQLYGVSALGAGAALLTWHAALRRQAPARN